MLTTNVSEAPAAPQAAAPPSAAPVGKSNLVGAAPEGHAAPGGQADGQAVAARGVEGAASEYPHRQQIEALFGRPITAKAALGTPAAKAACDALGAQAYTLGDRVAFASATPDLQLATHEAAHTVQQGQGLQLPGGFGHAGDAHEQVADQAAAHVSRGTSAAELFGDKAAAPAAPGGVQKQERPPTPTPTSTPDPAATSTPPPPTSTPTAPTLTPTAQPVATPTVGWQAVVAAVRRQAPGGGAHDYAEAMRQLEPLSMADMLHALQEVSGLGLLDAFYTAAGSHGSAKARAAFRTLAIEQRAASADRTLIDELNAMIAGLPLTDQAAIIAHVASATGRAGSTLLSEGVTAALTAAMTSMPQAQAAATSPVGPGPWSPPGNQPIPFYIGNEAHIGIALQYVAMHASDRVFTNTIPFSSILPQMPNAQTGGVTATDLALKPDLANITLRHLYEIKPVAQLALAQSELALYLGIFASAGVPMTPGPSSERGTFGVIQAPGGYYMYESPMPGVILYQYRRGQYQPVPQPQEQEQTAPRADPAFMQRMSELTGLTGAALLVYLIISEGTRLFPPRNLIPVP